MEKISLVVITYNEENNIRDCLNSLINLDYKNYEIIVVDASTDRTREIVKEFKNVKLVLSDNKKYGYQRNLGIKNSKYNLIAFTDADCIPPKDWLINLTENIKNNDCVGGSVRNPEHSNLIENGITALGFPAGGSLGIESFGTLSTCNCLFKKEIFDKIGFFNESLVYGGEDSELMERVKKNGFKIKLSNDCFVFHKPRNFKSFLKWNFKRGIARYNLYKNFGHFFMPLVVIVFPFSKKFRVLVNRKKEANLSLFNIFTIVIFLFFLRQLFMTFGWIYGFGQSISREKEY